MVNAFCGPCLIRGVVLNAKGRAVVAARVWWSSAPVDVPDTALLTDAQGCFVLSAPKPGDYTLRCDSDQHGGTEKQLRLNEAVRSLTLLLPN